MMLRSAACLLLLAVAAEAPAQEADYPTGVFIMKADGSDVRRVAQVKGCFDVGCPRFSRDGKRLAFVAAAGDPHGPRTCFVTNVDGTDLKEVGKGRSPDWSPDDKQITFVGDSGEVFVQNLDGQGRTEIAKGYCSRFSPDGGRIAVSDRHELRVVDLLSGEEATAFDNPLARIFDGFAWSPDGKRMAVVTRPEQGGKRQLFVVDAAGKNDGVQPRLEGSMGGFVSFSPDGRQIVFADGWKIKIVEIAGNVPAREVPGQEGRARHPVFSPDGKWIAFVSTREPAEGAVP